MASSRREWPKLPPIFGHRSNDVAPLLVMHPQSPMGTTQVGKGGCPAADLEESNSVEYSLVSGKPVFDDRYLQDAVISRESSCWSHKSGRRDIEAAGSGMVQVRAFQAASISNEPFCSNNSKKRICGQVISIRDLVKNIEDVSAFECVIVKICFFYNYYSSRLISAA